MSSVATPTSFAHADLDGRPARPASTAGLLPWSGNDPARQARTALALAWAADDSGDLDTARRHRLEAAWSLRRALRARETLHGNRAADLALLADILRRAAEFEGAMGAARRGLAAEPPAGVGALLWFQLERARACDDSRHDIGEAIAGLSS